MLVNVRKNLSVFFMAAAFAIMGGLASLPLPALATDPTDPDYAAAFSALWTKVNTGVGVILVPAVTLFGVMLVIGLIWKFGRRAVKA